MPRRGRALFAGGYRLVRYAIKRFRLHAANVELGIVAWATGQTGRITAAEADEDLRMLICKTATETVRVPFEAVASLVYSATPAAAAKKP